MRIDGGLRAHPTAAAVAGLSVEDLRRRRFSRSKAEYLIHASRLAATGELPIESLTDRSATSADALLRAIKGIGTWTSNYVLMRGCGFADCTPLGDTALTAALQGYFALERRPDPAETTTLMRQFAPFRSLATVHLWRYKWQRDAKRVRR